MWITDSAFYNNSARASGGALTNGDGVTTVDGSTFAGNNADASGGAIRLANGSVTLRNSTISGNRADEGGAIYTNGTLRFTHVTVSDNENTAGTASLEIAGGTTRMFGSIIANSVNAADCAVSGGSFVDEGYNLVEDGSCISAGISLSGDPHLDPLADNGGPPRSGQATKTHALQSDSPARNTVPPANCTLSVDQRDAPRPQGAGCDSGAYERESLTMALTAQQPGVTVNGSTPIHARLSPPAAGVTVHYTLASGGGSLDQLSAVTDESGTATVTYTAGNSSGVTRIDATADGYDGDHSLVYVAAATSVTRQERSSGNAHTIGNLNDYSIVAEQSGESTPWLGVARFAADPCPDSTQSVTPAGEYVDLLLEGTAGVNSLTVTVAYADTAATPTLYWCDANGEWQTATVGTVNADNKTITLVITDATSPSLGDLEGTPLVAGSNTPLAVSLGWFLAERNGDAVDFRWQTASESGTAGFNLLAAMGDGSSGDKVQLNPDLIPSPVIDSVEPADYAFSAVTNATLFYLQEIEIDGGVHEHGPFEVGVASGVEIGVEIGVESGNDGEMTPTLWLPIVSSATDSTDVSADGRSASVQEATDRQGQTVNANPDVANSNIAEAEPAISTADQEAVGEAGLLPKLWLPLVQR